MTWTGLGFTFLITVLCIEIYPLFNTFWTKARIQKNPIESNFDNREFVLLLSNFEVTKGANYSNTITSCFRCALAMIVAFSSIIGRAGALECFIVTLFGSFGYELNRQIISN